MAPSSSSDVLYAGIAPRARGLVASTVGFGAFVVTYYLAYRYGMSFSMATAAPFWFPDSVLLCALLATPRRRWWVLLVAILPLRLMVSVPTGASLGFLLSVYANDCLKGVAIAWALRRWNPDPMRFTRARDFGVYCLVAVLLVPAASALAGALARQSLGHPFWQSWEQWVMGNALAHLVLTPIMFYWLMRRPRFDRLSASRSIEAALLLVLLTGSLLIAFKSRADSLGFTDTRFYAPLAILVWGAIRFGMHGATAGIALLTIFAVHAALMGAGPFDASSPQETAQALQEFLLLRAAPLYLVAVLLQQNRSSEISLRESEQRLRDTANRYRAVVEAQSDMVCRMLPDTTLTFVNHACCRTLGRTHEQLLGTKLLALLPPSAREDAQRCIERAHSSKKPCSWECEFRPAGGHTGWQHWTVYEIGDSDVAVGELQAVGRDITDRRHAEESRRQLAHSARLATVGELTAMVAHQINQPLCAILVNAEAAEALLRKPEPSLREIREIIEDIRNDTLRADEAIQGTRALVRRSVIELKPVDLNHVVRQVLRLTAGDALHRRVRIAEDLAPALPVVLADASYLQQVLVNLLVNAMEAVDAVPEGSREISVTSRSLAADEVEVAVFDRGPGVAPEKVTQLFDSFFTTKPGGMGVGLSIARSIVLEHGGRLWVEDREGGGAVFRFTVKAMSKQT